MFDSNDKIIAISEIWKVSVSVYSVFEGQITQSTSVIVGQAVNKRNVSLLFSHELKSCHCDVLFPVEERERLGISDGVYFYRKILPKIFSLDSSTT